MAWDPDGRSWDVYVIPSRGGKPVRLTTNSAAEIRPNWSHDGKWIYYCSSQGGRPQVWKKPPTGGDEIQVTKNGGCQATESADGETFYYLKDDTALWKVPAGGGDESEVSDFKYGYGVQFTLVKNGAYFVDSLNTTTLKFLDFRTHLAKVIARLPGPVADGLAVSPDEQWLLYGQNDSAGSQLMRSKNFGRETYAGVFARAGSVGSVQTALRNSSLWLETTILLIMISVGVVLVCSATRKHADFAKRKISD
jgi:dipeptidyl aminopeptidase/acylaminoacyl peptidase